LASVIRPYPDRDPPLTELGFAQAAALKSIDAPDLLVVSPMTRTLQTAITIFGTIEAGCVRDIPIQIWPDLRETLDLECNKGSSRVDMQAKFPQVDFSECSEVWDYEPHSVEAATARAERVRRRLHDIRTKYKHVTLITHRGILAYLVKGPRFEVAGLLLFTA
jgi:broad specificity phosphatase PhoE